MNKRSFQAGVIVLALVLSAMACSFSFSSAEVQNLRMAKDEQGTTTATQFYPEDNIFVIGDLAKAPDDTDIKARWIAVEAEGVDKNKILWEHEARQGSGKFAIKLPTEAGPRPAGKYRVELYKNGDLDKSVDFEVLKSLSTPTPTFDPLLMETMPPVDPAGTPLPGVPGAAVNVTNVHTSKDEADTLPASAFSQADTIYIHFNVETGGGQAEVHGTLTAVAVEGAEPGFVFTEASGSVTNGPTWIKFSNSLAWPLGTYRVDLTVNNTPVQSLQIEVIATNTTGAQIQNAFSSLDKDGNQPGTVFPTTNELIYVQFTLAGAPAAVDVKGVLVARDVQGMEANTNVTDAGGQLSDGAYVFSFSNDGPWPVGSYSIFIYVNGQFAQQVDIQVQ